MLPNEETDTKKKRKKKHARRAETEWAPEGEKKDVDSEAKF